MSELIVIRLREVEQLNPLQRSIAKEAADALEAQAKRIAELEASLADRNEALQVMGLKLAHAEADNARLRVDAGQLWRALNDLSFECDGVIGTVKPPIETYNRTFGVMDSMRKKYAAMQSHSANTVGVPTPVMDAAPACESKE